MKRLIASALLALSSIAFGATLTPITLLNPAGSTSGQVIASTGASTPPAWTTITLSGLGGTVAIANGGTGATTQAGALSAILGSSTVPVANGGTGVTSAAAELARIAAAPLASPALTGTPTAPTATAGTNTTQLATTAFVNTAVTGATSAGGQPYFKAVMSGNQTLTANVATKITFNSKQEDSNSAYDATTNYRFTPQKSGLYWVSVTLSMQGTNTTTGNYTFAAWIFKNGSSYQGWGATGYAGASASVSATPVVVSLVRMNGTTDYLEAWGEIFNGQTSPTVNGGTGSSLFTAYYVGP